MMVGCSIVYASLLFMFGGDGIRAQVDKCIGGAIDYIRDGWCNDENNNDGCIYDGGDCCPCTCKNGLTYNCGSNDFFCRDPDSDCVDPGIEMYPNCKEGYIPDIGNQNCDEKNNNEECGYDGGDCCECTRTDDGSFSFSLCVDPSAPCYDPVAAALQSNCTDGNIPDIEDGQCNEENNNEGCLYDGGDCCECTRTNDASSSPFSLCVDPSAPCYDPAAAALQSSCPDGYIASIGDGQCNEKNNNEGCLYDGGDCCECTRIDNGSSSYFSLCVDPSAPCYDPAAVALKSNCSEGHIANIEDGQCDENNNNEGCLYDGGDCCECTRTGNGSSPSFHFCVDPSAACFDPAAVAIQSNCNHGNITHIGDGSCDADNNNEGCLYDGGDCCFCTCTHDDCGIGKLSCEDPYAADLESYICMELSPTNTSCLAGLQHEWVVETSAQARELAKAVRCSGGVFNVWWKGEITVDETIYIADGTVLNVTNGDDNSAIIGDGQTRLFTVVNASLYLQGIIVSNGNAVYGGAIAASRSRLTFERVTFVSNNAIMSGGALSLSGGTTAVFRKETVVFNNTAHDGGAIYATGGSNVSWTENTIFSENSATSRDGGALYVTNGSSVVWMATSHFLNNSAKRFAGALYIESDSIAVWTATSYFSANTANIGGALLLSYGSTATWSAESFFYANSAGFAAGALFLVYSSTASWGAESFFCANSASSGGALLLLYGSTSAWSAESYFYANSAQGHGGALYASDYSSAAWNAESFFYANSANHYGGALFLLDGSTAAWYENSFLQDNSAKYDGGAVFANNAALLWNNDDTIFINNTARNGGAVFVRNGATAEWTGNTHFQSNRANLDGGAVGSRAFVLDQRSLVTIRGSTSFVNNTCGANGGAMAVVLSLAVFFKSDNIVFLYNSAGISGGAVFDAGTGIGTVYRNITFLGNIAQTGGGIHIVGSGTTVTINENNEQVTNPSTFDGCTFLGNFAFGIGGAIDSASGQDVFNRTLFKGNNARVGGALRLAGKALVIDCSFIENVSDLGGGPAMSNVGYMYNVTNSYFLDNEFNCEIETFLDYKTGGFFKTVCDGCPETCLGCSFVEGDVRPTCTSLPEAGIEHASSEGGLTKVEELYIYEGYWRATKTSTNVNKCFNSKACTGGITDASDYCLSGYEGRYCSVCSKNYVSSRRFVCRECSNRTTSIAIATVVSCLVAAVGLSLFSYLVSSGREGTGRGVIDRITQRIPKQSVKIIIVVWQILTQFASMANVTFPGVYQKLLNGVDFLNFDLSWFVSAGCFLEIDFHDRLLWTTIAPPITMCLLGGTYAFAVYRHRKSPETALSNVHQKHRSMALLITFLVYSSVSSVVFQAFACESLDDGKRYLRADYTIECDSAKHKAFQVYAGLMIIVYPLGIPVCYALLLFSNRHVLRDEKHREESLVVRPTSDLWKPYKPERFYYEVIECSRRILLAGFVVFFYPNTAAQIAVALALAFVFIFVSETMAPYQSQWDAWISRLGHAIVFVSMYIALLLKVDVSGENNFSQKTFEVILVVAHGCMILAMVIEAVIMAFILGTVKPQEHPRPVQRRSSSNSSTV